MSLFSKLFGGKKKAPVSDVGSLVQETIEGLLEKANFDLHFEIITKDQERGQDSKQESSSGHVDSQILIEFSGPDEELLRDKEGQMIDSIQLFIKRVIQHHFPEDRTEVIIDCNGFIEESSKELVELAEKLKGIALEKGKSVYFRALPPKDRKVIHQYLAADERVKSRSVGDGLFKKIKIYPVKGASQEESSVD